MVATRDHRARKGGLAGSVVVVTGASSGIGRALCKGFAGEGAQVIGFGRDADALRLTAQQCPEGMFESVGDVTEDADLDRLFAQAEERGGVRILVCCAGRRPETGLLDGSWSDWREAIEVNLSGVAGCCKRALAQMKGAHGGRIVVLGSRAGVEPLLGEEAYSASKAGVNVLVRGLAADLRREGRADILIDVLFPGPIRSKMSKTGDDPARVYPWVRALVQRPDASPTGQLYLRDKPFEPEHPAELVARALRRWLRRTRG